MSDEEYIRKAVDLAYGWEWRIEDEGDVIKGPDRSWYSEAFSQGARDALAAQLVRQVDALGNDAAFVSMRDKVVVTNYLSTEGQADERSPDRTMNAIKAIVDSGVLAATEQGEKDE